MEVGSVGARPPGPNAADMKGVLDKLPQGSKPNIREVRRPEDLEALKRWMTQGGVDGQNRYGDPGRGAWKVLPDGSEVGERYAAKSTGTNSLDIDLKSADGTEHWKVHINPKTGFVYGPKFCFAKMHTTTSFNYPTARI